MRIKLNKHWIEILSNLPESGMGYQKVDVKLRNGKVIKGALVFNSEELEISNNKFQVKISDIIEIELSEKYSDPSLTR